MDLFDFGHHTPYIAVAYGVSIIVIVGLIIHRRAKLKKALERNASSSADGR